LCKALGATRNIDASYRRILALYRTPARAYHNIRHVEYCLREFAAVSRMAANPAAVEAAIWFHDAVYNSKAAWNEEKSAAVAAKMLHEMGVGSRSCASVRKLILITRHTCTPRTTDGRIIADIDLAILASKPSVFDHYERGVRNEYIWVEDSVFVSKRADFLKALLSRKRIYSTDFFRTRYEARARKNLSRSVSELGKWAGSLT
jgi:predicted metal-dependent HD superfamily phosphohydrolase